jgi:pyrroline-5-carboxylate reductase
MLIMGWTACQENATEICGFYTKSNRIIYKQTQQIMVGVKPHFLQEVLNALH